MSDYDLEECKDLIIALHVEQGLPLSEVAEELIKRGYRVTPAKLASFIKTAKIDVSKHEGKEIAKMFMDAVKELWERFERLKKMEGFLDVENADDVKRNLREIVDLNRLLQDMILNFAKLTGQLTASHINIEKQEVNVYQVNQALNILLVKLADEKKISILDPELKDLYERVKKRESA